MKIRNGFVSNSSSASYTIIIDMELNEFIDNIFSEFNITYFWVKDLIDEYIDKRNEYKKNLDISLTLPKYYSFHNQEGLDKLDLIIERLNAIKDLDEQSYCGNEEGKFVIDKVNAVTWLLKEIYSVDLNLHTSKSIQLECGSSMHNSYQDVPSIVKTILTYFDFEYPLVKKICQKKGD
jgi:hypothetical protein